MNETFSPMDHHWMARAIQLAEKGHYTTGPNPRVGCVIVKDEQVIGEGFHQCAGEPHAEAHALNMAADRASGATVYVSLEPCSHTGKTPPCADALIAAGVKRVIAAMEDPNPQVKGQGIARLLDAGISTATGLLAEQAAALNPGFIKRMQKGLPWLRIKMAMSLDGRSAMASGESQWITGEAARLDVQRLRASSGAILTGKGTVLLDDPSMNVRISAAELGCEIEPPMPLVAIVDSDLQTPVNSRIFDKNDRVLIFHAGNEKRPDYPEHVRLQVVKSQLDGLDLEAVLRQLADQDINECHVEAGAILAGALLTAGLVDEIVLYVAPHIMGDQARGLFHLPGLAKMKDRISLQIQDIRAVGEDWKITARPVLIYHVT